MKKIIRQILDDLKSRPAHDNNTDSVASDLPKLFEPSTAGFDQRQPKLENQGEIAITQSKPVPENLGDTDFNPKPQAEIPQDLNNQELSADPAERTRQEEFQAHRNEEIQTIG